MKRIALSVGLAATLLASLAAVAQQVTIAVVWSGTELDAFRSVIAAFEAETGFDVAIDEVGRDLPTVLPIRVAAGNPPDLAALPNPGQMREFAEQGALVVLDDLANLADHPEAFVDLGSVDGHVYGVFIAADLKSLVWYAPCEFVAMGYDVPTSWSELIALSNQIVADGGTPWAIGLESGAASGWVATDWIEDIMLRTAGPDLYDQWVNHEIPWTHPAVRNAWEYFGQIIDTPGFVYGGPVGALTINFGDSPSVLFDDPPGAYMHRQATFIQSFILDANPDLVSGEDYDVFTFPSILSVFGTPLLGSGDLIGVFNDTTEAIALADYLASAEAQEIWCGALGKLGINKNVDPSVYPDPITANAAAMLAEAEIFRFDASDLMPAAVGSGTFWTGVLDYISGIPLDTVLEAIEDSAIEAYGDAPPDDVRPDFSFEEAREKVIDEVIQPDLVDGLLIGFGWPELLTQGDVVSAADSDGPEFPIGSDCWFFWLDDAPRKGFAHTTRYVLVTQEGGYVTVHEVDWWPVLNGDAMWGTPEEYWDEGNWIWSNASGPSSYLDADDATGLLASTTPIAMAAQATSRLGWNPVGAKYKHMIIQGPDSYGCMQEDADNWYRMATQNLMLNDSDIIYLASYTRAAQKPDGADGVCTLANIRNELNGLGLVAGDWLTVFITAHGAENGDRTVHNRGKLTSSDLATRIGALAKGVHVIVVVQGCFGGRLIQDLDDHPGIVDLVVTATDATNVSFADIDNGNKNWHWADPRWKAHETATRKVQVDPNPSDTGSEFSSGFIEQMSSDARAFRIDGRYSYRELIQRAFDHARANDSTYQNRVLLESRYNHDGESQPDPQIWRSADAVHRMASVVSTQGIERVYDLVGTSETPAANDKVDGRFKIELKADDGATLNVRSIELRASWGGHVWDTTPGNGVRVIGVADSANPQTLLNKADGSVDIIINGSRTLYLYCENDESLWGSESGGEFDLKITFGNGQVLRSMITLAASRA